MESWRIARPLGGREDSNNYLKRIERVSFLGSVEVRAEDSAQIVDEEWKKREKARNGGGNGKSGSWRIEAECRGRSSSGRETSPNQTLQEDCRNGLLARRRPSLEGILKGKSASVWGRAGDSEVSPRRPEQV